MTVMLYSSLVTLDVMVATVVLVTEDVTAEYKVST